MLRNARRSAQAIELSAGTIEAYARKLESSEARFRDVAEASSDWIWETDRELRFTYLSAASPKSPVSPRLPCWARRSTTSSGADAVDRTGGPAQRPGIAAAGTFDLRCFYRDAAGEVRVCRLAGPAASAAQARSFKGYRGTAADITAEVEAHARANHLALHDPLTELPNRVLLRERLDLALAAARRQRARSP